jgi:hypothetical protein
MPPPLESQLQKEFHDATDDESILVVHLAGDSRHGSDYRVCSIRLQCRRTEQQRSKCRRNGRSACGQRSQG